MKDNLSRKEITRCLVNGFDVYMNYRVELGQKHTIWALFGDMYQYTLNMYRYTLFCFSYFDQFSYFSHTLLISYPI